MNVKINSVKKGDTIPVYGRVQIISGGIDVSEDRDFSNWGISCDLVNAAGTKVFDIDVQFVNTSPVFAGQLSSANCNTLTVGQVYSMDLRFKDADGVVRSTGTQQIQIAAAVSELP